MQREIEDDITKITNELNNDEEIKAEIKAIEKVKEPRFGIFVGEQSKFVGLATLGIVTDEALYLEIDSNDRSEEELDQLYKSIMDEIKKVLKKFGYEEKR